MPRIGRSVRRCGELHRLEQGVSVGRIPGFDHHMSSLDGSVRRGRQLHRQQRRVPDGWQAAGDDALRRDLERRRLRRHRLLQRLRYVRRRLSIGHHNVPSFGGSVRRRRKLHGFIGCLPGERLPALDDNLRRHLERRRLRR